MSGKSAREARRDERLQAEGEDARAERRRSLLLKLGSAAVFLAIVAVAVLIVVNSSSTDGGDTELESVAEVESDLRGLEQNGLTLGEPSAAVTLIEFGDLQCPFCKRFSEGVVPEVIDSRVRTGEAKLEFRNFAILGEESVSAAAAALAAGQQGRGWSFIELFYRNQGLEKSGYVSDDFLTELARGAKVPDITRWNKARNSSRLLRQVESEFDEAQQLGFNGTPSFAVSGPGVQGEEALQAPGDAAALEEAIESAS